MLRREGASFLILNIAGALFSDKVTIKAKH